MTLDAVATLIFLLVLLLIPGWSVWRLVRGVRTGDWRRPGWFGHAAWASFYLMALAWLRGLFTGGLDTEETCTIFHRQPFDEVYREAHRAEFFRLFPLSNRCNADYDMVPAWVNPTVAVFFLLLVVSAAGLVWTTTHRARATPRQKETTP